MLYKETSKLSQKNFPLGKLSGALRVVPDEL